MQTKYVSYRKLMAALKRSKVINTGKTATLLLDTFVHNNGDLKASRVITDGLCEEGKFNEWRKEMIRKKWLHYELGSYSKHQAGEKLIKYINEENQRISPFSTKNDVDLIEQKFDRKLNAMQARLDKFDTMVKIWIEGNDDPWTQQKQESYSNNPLRMVKPIKDI